MDNEAEAMEATAKVESATKDEAAEDLDDDVAKGAEKQAQDEVAIGSEDASIGSSLPRYETRVGFSFLCIKRKRVVFHRLSSQTFSKKPHRPQSVLYE